MKLTDYPQSLRYTTNLDYPKVFHLVLPPHRKDADNRKLKPLVVGDWVQLPIFRGINDIKKTYKVTGVSADSRVTLEAISFRMTFVESEVEINEA